MALLITVTSELFILVGLVFAEDELHINDDVF